jgi:hypothetical protein
MFVNINESNIISVINYLNKLTLILNKFIPKAETVFEACTHLRADVGLAGSLRQLHQDEIPRYSLKTSIIFTLNKKEVQRRIHSKNQFLLFQHTSALI